MSSKILFYDPMIINVPVDDTTAIAKGDMLDLSSGKAIPAASVTWNTSLAQTQTDMAAAFLGVADSAKIASDGQTTIRVATRPVVEFDCASATFSLMDKVGAAKQSGNALENQKVAAVANVAYAIGRVYQNYASATTKVKVMVKSLLYGAMS